MKLELKKILLPLGLVTLASALSSCSLLGKEKYASQWEIQSEVPASLSTGRATTPTATATAKTSVKSNLDGLPPAAEGSLDLPITENGMLMDIPKPNTSHLVAAQSPPEMLNIPASEGVSDLPYARNAPGGIETLLPPLPPAVTEEALNLAPAALAEVAAETETLQPLPAVSELPIPLAQTTIAAPSIPLLYGKLDLAPFLNPPAPLAANTPQFPAAQ